MRVTFSSAWFVGAAAALTFVTLVARNVVSPTYRWVRRIFDRLDELGGDLAEMRDMLGSTRRELGLPEWSRRRRRSERRRREREDRDNGSSRESHESREG